MITPETTPLYQEQKIAALFGLTRNEYRHVRREVLKKQRDWTIMGREGVLTQPALDRLVKYLQKTSNADLGALDFATCRFVSPAEKKEGAASDTTIATLTVRSLVANPRLLRAATGAGELVMVRVPSSVNFRPKMELRGRLVQPGIYQLEGRCPRQPGRY